MAEGSEDNRKEAPMFTEEEQLINNLWDAQRFAKELDALYSTRSHLKAAIHRPRAGEKITPGELEAHPLYVLVQTRIAALQDQMEQLI